MPLAFLVKEATPYSFSVANPPLPELEGFTEIANTLLSSTETLGGWQPGSSMATAPAGLGLSLPGDIHPNVCQAPDTR